LHTQRDLWRGCLTPPAGRADRNQTGINHAAESAGYPTVTKAWTRVAVALAVLCSVVTAALWIGLVSGAHTPA
jgi:hypothetical protein